MKVAFFPNSDQGKADWLDNFHTKLGGYATLLGVSAGEVTSVTNDTAMFNYIMDMQEAFKTFKQDVSKYKNYLRDGSHGAPIGDVPEAPTLPVAPTAVNDGIFTRTRKLVARIKTHSAYTEAIGEDLGIVGDEQVINIPNLKPELKSRLDANRPLIIWSKGPADSIDIYVDRKDGSGFVFLATDSQPDYLDTFPVPAGVASAVWEYKAIYRIGDEQVGQFSETVKVTVTRQVGY